MGVRSWWSDISTQKAPVTNSLARAKSGTVSQFSQFDVLVPWWARYNEELFVREAYRQNPLVRECIEYRCRSVATATIYAMRNGPNGDERITPGHWMQRLLRRPSQLYPTQTRWIRQIERQLLITGECFVYLARTSNGTVKETQILPGSAIQVIPGKEGIKRYDYRPDGQNDPIKIRSENMIFFRYDDPRDALRGVSPLAAAWREIQTDNSMQDYRKAFFDNAAIVGGILTTNMPANAEQLRQWSEDFTDKFSGAKNSGKTPALAGGLEYQRAGATPQEIDFGNVGAIPESRICMAFGVSPILIAAKIGLDRSTYSNAKEAKALFWEDTTIPEMGMLEDELTVGLTQLGDPNFCQFDISRVPGLDGHREKVQLRTKDGLINGAITVNEYREQNGLNTVPDGDVYYRPAGATVVPSGELDVPPPDPMEIAEKQAEIAAKAKGGDEDQGGRPANDDKDQTKAPSPKSANSRELPVEEAQADPVVLPEHIPDNKLLRRLEDLSYVAEERIRHGRFDRALFVAQVAGEVRGRLARLARSGNEEDLTQEELEEWLDLKTIALGNEIAGIALRGETETIYDVAGLYTTEAIQAFTELTAPQGG